MAANRLFVLSDSSGPVVWDESLEELCSYYLTGDPSERIHEYKLVREIPIEVDFQANPEDNDAPMV